MGNTRVAERYAKSVLGLAKERGELSKVVEDMALLKKASTYKDLMLLLKSPIIHSSKKKAILQLIFENKISNLTSQFICLMTDKGRENLLPEIAETALAINRKENNIVKVLVTTAVEPTKEILDQIKSKINALLPGKSLELDIKIDKSIMGGFILAFDNQEYSASIAYSLEKIKKTFSA